MGSTSRTSFGCKGNVIMEVETICFRGSAGGSAAFQPLCWFLESWALTIGLAMESTSHGTRRRACLLGPACGLPHDIPEFHAPYDSIGFHRDSVLGSLILA